MKVNNIMFKRGDTVSYVGTLYKALTKNGNVAKVDKTGFTVEFGEFIETFQENDLKLVSSKQDTYLDFCKRTADSQLKTLKQYYPWNDTMIARAEWIVKDLSSV